MFAVSEGPRWARKDPAGVCRRYRKVEQKYALTRVLPKLTKWDSLDPCCCPSDPKRPCSAPAQGARDQVASSFVYPAGSPRYGKQSACVTSTGSPSMR